MSKLQIGNKVSFVNNPNLKGTVSSRVDGDGCDLYVVMLDETLESILIPDYKLQKVSN